MDHQAMLSQEMSHMVPSDAPQVPPADVNFPLSAMDSIPQSAPPPDVHLLPQQWQSAYTVVHGQVMTEEQLETLRRQISVYATICKQLVEMHKAVVAQQNTLPGLRLGQSVPYDPANHSAKQFGSRQRWTPSQTQLQVLEKIFEQGSGTINKQRIKEITMELTQYGPISETNVYNWFQNRRARTKRKQQVGGPNNGESEFDTDNDSPEEKRVKTERDLSNESYGMGQVDTNFQSIDSAEHQLFDPQKRVQPSLMHEQVDHFAVTPNRTLHDGHAFASSSLPGSVSLMGCKPWNAPPLGIDVNSSHVGVPVSQEFQGQQAVINGSGNADSFKLLHEAENHRFAE